MNRKERQECVNIGKRSKCHSRWICHEVRGEMSGSNNFIIQLLALLFSPDLFLESEEWLAASSRLCMSVCMSVCVRARHRYHHRRHRRCRPFHDSGMVWLVAPTVWQGSAAYRYRASRFCMEWPFYSSFTIEFFLSTWGVNHSWRCYEGWREYECRAGSHSRTISVCPVCCLVGWLSKIVFLQQIHVTLW